MADTDTRRLSGLQCRRLAKSHVPGAHALSREARWNQTPRDWEYMIEQGEGWAFLDDPGNVVATALSLPHREAGFGWISMVLVARAWRRHGLAGRLLDKCVGSLLADGCTPGLDATQGGRRVYLQNGFCDVYPLTRMVRAGGAGEPGRAAGSVRALRPADRPDILDNDRAACGCERGTLLSHLHARAPKLAWLGSDGTGHCFGRDGHDAAQIGPLVATRDTMAIDLARTALGEIAGAAYIDVPDHQEAFMGWLRSTGFTAQRGFVRMLHGRTRPFGDPAKIYAIAGPELG